jgi:hypothetical protein
MGIRVGGLLLLFKRILAVVSVVTACVVILGCGGGGGRGGGRLGGRVSYKIGKADFTIGEFRGNPRKFKGQPVRLKDLTYGMKIPLRDIQKRTEAETYRIYLTSSVSPKIDLGLDVPKTLDVPNIETNDVVAVTFRCTQGDSTDGNIVVSVTR